MPSAPAACGDNVTTTESTMTVPDVRVKEGKAQLAVYRGRQIISSRGKLILREFTLYWQADDAKKSRKFDLTSLDVDSVNKDHPCQFELYEDNWHGAVLLDEADDCSDWVESIWNNTMILWMKKTMWSVFCGPIFQASWPYSSQDMMYCREIYRRYCEKLSSGAMTRDQIQSLNKLLDNQYESCRLEREVVDLEKAIHDKVTFAKVDDKTRQIIQDTDSQVNTIGTSMYSLQKDLIRLEESTISDTVEVKRIQKQTNRLMSDMERLTSKLTHGKAMMLSRERRQYDFYVCYDEEEKASLPLAEDLTATLEREGFVGQYKARECPPGSDIGLYHRSSCRESDIVICLISKVHLEAKTGIHLDNIEAGMKIKKEQGADEHIIPVIYGADVSLMMRGVSPLLSLLKLSEFVSTIDEDWQKKTLAVFEQLPCSNALKRLYSTLLPEWCAPLLRGPLPLEKAWLDVFLDPEITIKSIINGQHQRDADLDRVSGVIDLFDVIKPGGRVVIIADGGMGKSTVVSHITRTWGRDNPTMKKYSFVFLAPQRLIHNHRGGLDSIICEDLKLLKSSSKAKFRHMVRSYPAKSLFLVDGFDELESSFKIDNTFIQLMRGDIACKSTVIVTTRPHSADEVLKLMGGTYIDVRIEGLSDETVMDRALDILTETTKQPGRDQASIGAITDYLPIELLRIPLLLNIASYVWKCDIHDLHDRETIRKFSSMTDIFNAIWGIMIGIKEEKRRRSENVNFYKSMEDSNIPRSTWSLLQALAAMSFECLERGELIISTETLAKYRLNAINCGQIGFIHISSGSNPQGTFVHNLFMEHCAGFHIANNDKALQLILAKISNSHTTLSNALGLYTNALVFAVGFKPQILDQLSRQKFMIPVVKVTGSENTDMDLSLEAQLVQECSSDDARNNFCQTLMTSDFSAPLTHTSSHRLNALGYEWIHKCLGVETCLKVLRRIHMKHVTSVGLVLQGHDGKRYITDTFLLSHLPYITFREVNTLHVHNSKMFIKADTAADHRHPQTGGIDNLHLDEIDWSIDQLVRFINQVPALCNLKNLSLGRLCKLKPILTEENRSIQLNIGELGMNCPLSLDLLRSMLCVISCQRLIIGKDSRLQKKTTNTAHPPDNTKRVNELYIPSSWSTDDVANLITEVPSLTQLTRVNIHTLPASEAAEAVKGSITISQNGQEVEFLGEEITQSMAATITSPWLSNIKYIKCPPASSITINQRQHTSELGKMMISAKRSEVELEGQVPVYWIAAICLKWGKDTMNITGASSIMDSSDLSIHHGHGGCVRRLTLRDVHCEVDTLVNILSLVGHPEAVELTLDAGCVLDAPSTTTTTPQRAVCHVGTLRLYVQTTLSDVILNRLLSQLDVVDGLILRGCKVTSEEGSVTTLTSVRELWLEGARGLRCWFQHVRMPGVTGVMVVRWASGEEEDTVSDGIIQQACPQAEVDYYTRRIEK